MGHYKIKNMTALLPKRDANKNKTIVFEYKSGFDEKTCEIPVGGEIFIECNNLPISLHKLRINKLVSINEISKNDFLKKQNVKPLPVVVNEVVKKEKKVVVEPVSDNEYEEKRKRSYSTKKQSDHDSE